MKNIIREMLNGKKGNFENIKFFKKYYELFNIVVELEKSLQKLLSFEEWKSYLQLSNMILEMNLEENEIIYEEGFSFGLLLGVQASEISNNFDKQ